MLKVYFYVYLEISGKTRLYLNPNSYMSLKTTIFLISLPHTSLAPLLTLPEDLVLLQWTPPVLVNYELESSQAVQLWALTHGLPPLSIPRRLVRAASDFLGPLQSHVVVTCPSHNSTSVYVLPP